MTEAVQSVYERAGYGLVELTDGCEAAPCPELFAVLERFWWREGVHTLAVIDPRRRVTVSVDLVRARAITRPGGIPAAIAAAYPPPNPSQAFVNLLHVVRDACRTSDVEGVTDQGVEPVPVNRVGVVGGGTMGSSIAHAYAAAGLPVLLKEVNAEALERAMVSLRALAEVPVGPASPARREVEALLGRVTPTLDFSGFDELDLVVESVPEVLELKKIVFAELDSVCAPHTILASNTSSLSIADMATATTRPRQVVGHHFFHPVPWRPLMEIARTAVTSVETLVTSIAVAQRIGKAPIVVPDVIGFLANRIPAYSAMEMGLLVEEGASPERIDSVALSLGLSLGPLQGLDMVGHDVGQMVSQVMHEHLARARHYPVAEHRAALVERGRLGVKSGVGYYLYRPGDPVPVTDPELAPILEEARRRSGIRVRDDITDLEIADRLILPTVNHGADALAEGVAASPAAIDVAMVLGYGQPAVLGGPMRWADQLGTREVVDRLRRYEERFGPRFAPSEHLLDLARAGRGFYD